MAPPCHLSTRLAPAPGARPQQWRSAGGGAGVGGGARRAGQDAGDHAGLVSLIERKHILGGQLGRLFDGVCGGGAGMSEEAGPDALRRCGDAMRSPAADGSRFPHMESLTWRIQVDLESAKGGRNERDEACDASNEGGGGNHVGGIRTQTRAASRPLLSAISSTWASSGWTCWCRIPSGWRRTWNADGLVGMMDGG